MFIYIIVHRQTQRQTERKRVEGERSIRQNIIFIRAKYER